MMPRMRKGSVMITVAAATALLALAGCAPADEKSTTATGGDDCAKDSLATLKAGVLTFGTDQPAYPPWFVDDDPANGKGFESAVAYAVADKLGLSAPKTCTWVRVPFNAAIAPGPKTFDANLNEFSITDERKKAVDFSSPYYDVTQAVVDRQVLPGGEGHDAGRSAGSQARRAGRHHQLQRRQRRSTQTAGLGLQQQRRRQGGADQRPDRRAGARPADRVPGAERS